MRKWLSRIRLILAVAGLVFAVAGVATDNHLIVWAAIALLAISFLIRLVLKRSTSETTDRY